MTGSGPLGCVPSQLASSNSNGQCAYEPQQASALFNPQLVEMIQSLNQELGSDYFIASNANMMQGDFISNPQAFGKLQTRDISIH